MGPVTLSLGAKVILLGKRFWPWIAVAIATASLIWVVSDRISDAETRADAAVARAERAEANSAQWQLASQAQSQSILKLAESYKTLSTSMTLRDKQFEGVWHETLIATSKLEENARRLIAIPASRPEDACRAANAALHDVSPYAYVIRIPIPPAKGEGQ